MAPQAKGIKRLKAAPKPGSKSNLGGGSALDSWNFPVDEAGMHRITRKQAAERKAAGGRGDLAKILTSDQFVAGIIATLALKGLKNFVLTETELDKKFEAAFDDLTRQEERLGVRTNFTFYVDPFHGDSVSLRETLLAAKEKELIALNNPTFRTFDVILTDERAKNYLSSVPLPQSFLNKIVEKHFET